MALSLMLSAATVWKSFGAVIALHDRVKAVECAADLRSQTQPFVHIPHGISIFQDDNITVHSNSSGCRLKCSLIGEVLKSS